MGIALRSRPARQAAALLIVAPLAAAPLLLAGTAGAQAGGAEVKGTIDNKFDPQKLEIKVGDTVTWTLDGAHSVNGGTDGKQDPESPMNSQIGVPTYEATFDKEGTFPYFCQPHFSLGMVGEIVVTKTGGGAKPTGGAASPTQTAAAPVATSTPAPKDPNLGKATFEKLDEQKAEPADAMTNFRYLLWGLTAATLVLSVGVFASTRPRRES